MKVEKFCEEIIKPSSPTPQHLKTYKLSLLDQISFIKYSPVIYFYHSDDEKRTETTIATLLKTSLSKTLTQFYPFAARFIDHNTLYCDDQGVEFVQARVDSLLSTFLQQQHPDSEQLKKLLPVDTESTAAYYSCLLAVQLNFFQCGGIALAICTTHKIVDGVSWTKFVNTWASIACQQDHHVNLDFSVGSSVFLPRDDFALYHHITFPRGKCIMRRFVFRASSVAALKLKASSKRVPQPTRAEVVTALLWKCAITTEKAVIGLDSELSISIGNRAVDLRRIVSPRLSNNAMGNFLAYVATQVELSNEIDEIDLQEYVWLLRNTMEDYKKKNEGENALMGLVENQKLQGLLMEKNAHFFSCSSMLGLPIYEADFGFGKLIYWTFVRLMLPSTAFLLDKSDGDGIEALVWLSKENMSVFECNKELLQFATLSPTIYQASCI